MNETTSTHSARGIAWLALMLAVVALLFAISAYGVSRSAARETEMVSGEQSSENAASQLAAARREARESLLAARANLEENNNYEVAVAQAEQAEDRLYSAYRDARAETSDEWLRLQAAFDTVEVALRNKSADALEGLQALLAWLASDVRVDEMPQEVGE